MGETANGVLSGGEHCRRTDCDACAIPIRLVRRRPATKTLGTEQPMTVISGLLWAFEQGGSLVDSVY
jgi:hypothetical protein